MAERRQVEIIGVNHANRQDKIADGLLPIRTAGNTAFGEQSVAELTPQAAVDFSYNINDRVVETRLNNGAATVDANRLKLSTGAAANQAAQLLTRRLVQYQPGQGALARFTGVFTTGVANSSQIIGIGDVGDGYFFGYNGSDFGVLRRVGGVSEVRTLTVTTASTTAENITITLDGDADATVAVTNSSNTTTTANEIAANDYSNLGTGWRAYAKGATVIFVSYDTAAHSGTFSLSGASTAVGTFAQTLAANPATDNWVTQTNWSTDAMDGTGPSGMTLDPTKGNIFQVRYQWLGYGIIRFYIENSESGEFQEVHAIQYANANTTPSIYNPSLPLFAEVKNTSNTSNIILYSGSMAGFIEGRQTEISHRHGAVVENTDIDEATLQPVLTLLNDVVFASKGNRQFLKINSIHVATSVGNKPVNFVVAKDGTLTGASYAAVNGGTSFSSIDSSASAIANYATYFALTLNASQGENIDLSGSSITLRPGERITVAAQQTGAGTNATVNVSINWEEFF